MNKELQFQKTRLKKNRLPFCTCLRLNYFWNMLVGELRLFTDMQSVIKQDVIMVVGRIGAASKAKLHNNDLI